jgi:hypothetical protein
MARRRGGVRDRGEESESEVRLTAGIDIVTGGLSGSGAAVVDTLIARGRHLVVLDLRPPPDACR